MDKLGIGPSSLKSFGDFFRISPTIKADITANFPDRISSSDRKSEPWRCVSTSGTTGRMTLIHDFRKKDFVRATLLFVLHCAQPAHDQLGIGPAIRASFALYN